MFQIGSADHRFSFKPYMMLQTTVNYNYYDDEGLDKAYNQDNVANSGFAIPYAVLGFTGKAFDHITYNLSVNAAATGANILQQAWFDVKVNNGFAVRVGKFKTPFTSAYLTTLGETLMPILPVSLTATTIMPYSLNAVMPKIGTGFDLGVMLHGDISPRSAMRSASSTATAPARTLRPKHSPTIGTSPRSSTPVDSHGHPLATCRAPRATPRCWMRTSSRSPSRAA